MIEADVTMGKLFTDGIDYSMVIMAHGPQEVQSDLTLENFLKKVDDHNKNIKEGEPKGIKLDFKSLEAYKKAQDLLKTFHEVSFQSKKKINTDVVQFR